jgi:hypothetical protein
MPESRIPIIIAWIFKGCSVVARIHSVIEVTNIRSVTMHKKLDFDNEALMPGKDAVTSVRKRSPISALALFT